MSAAEKGELPEGTRLLDRYTIIDRVASGGMASIYRAMDERLDRVVCVKLLRLVMEGSGSTSGRSLYEATYSHFLQEALALSRLQHPNTLRIYDFGYFEGEGQAAQPFQISEFLDGGNLEQYVRARGPLSADETCAILERIAGAVGEAHEHAIIHRDIKPSNILFGRMGQFLTPKLADFGIAHSNLHKKSRPGQRGWADETGDEEVSTITLFSPRWAAPEQLAGSTQGAATDVYAMGLVAVYMLLGKALFEGIDVRVTFAERVRGDEYVLKLMEEHGLALEVRQVLAHAMAAVPEQRYPTPAAFFEALQRVLLQSSVRPLTVPPAPGLDAGLTGPRASVTLSVEQVLQMETQNVPPPEQAIEQGGSRVRIVDVHEKLDVSTFGAEGGSGAEIRFRVSFLPSRGNAFRINIKGLNCFVRGPNGRSTPALVAEADGGVSFVSTASEELGHITWSFGQPHTGQAAGRVFRIDTGEMVVPSSQATQAVALYLGRDRDVIIMCRR